ncbi:MAG TPA: PRC and DUF2382 domain-containing protein [Longimicrobium sp.]|nr:PRC and DUF2382 domain-containing protein [Longimicrobium sp.]
MDESMDDLVSLGELGAGADLGLTGRPVFAGDGTLLGEVADVLGDARGDGPRFLAIALEASVARMQGGKRVFVPFGSVRVDDVRRVHLDGVTGESATTLPVAPTNTPLPFRDPDATVLDHARAADSLASSGIAAPAAAQVHGGFGAGTGGLAGTAPAGTHGLAADAPARELAGSEERVVLSEEELVVGKREVAVGEVVVQKHIEEQVIRQTVPVMREKVEVERRPLPPGAGLEPRTEGDVMYIPLVEEELIVTKRLIAREELVIRKTRVTEEQVVEETVRRERAEVVGPDGARDLVG